MDYLGGLKRDLLSTATNLLLSQDTREGLLEPSLKAVAIAAGADIALLYLGQGAVFSLAASVGLETVPEFLQNQTLSTEKIHRLEQGEVWGQWLPQDSAGLPEMDYVRLGARYTLAVGLRNGASLMEYCDLLYVNQSEDLPANIAPQNFAYSLLSSLGAIWGFQLEWLRTVGQLQAERERAFYGLFRDNPLPMWLYDRNSFRFLEVNHAAIVCYGYSREEFLSMTILDIRPEEDVQALLEYLIGSQQPLSSPRIWRHHTKSGTVIEVEIVRHFTTFEGQEAALVVIHDVTQRRVAERAAQAANEELTTIFNSMTDAFLVLDHEWRFVKLNPQGERLLGRSQRDLLGKVVWEEFPQGADSTFYTEYHRAIKENTQVEFLAYYAALNTWLEVRAYPSSVGLSVYFHEVSQRVRAEQQTKELLSQLERERSLLKAVIDQLPLALVIVEAPGGRIIEGNLWFQALMGPDRPVTSLGEYATRLTAYHLDGHRYAPQEQLLPRVLAGEVIAGEEMRLERSDGTQAWINITAGPVRDEADTVIAAVFTAEDISRRHQQEEAIRISEQRYRLVSRATHDVIWDWDISSDKVLWNENLRHSFGHEIQELTTDSHWWLQRVHPEDRERVWDSLQRVIQGQSVIWQEEYRFQKADGIYAEVIDRSYVDRDFTGGSRRMIGSMSDVTELRRIASEKQELNEQLQRRIQRLVALREIDRAIASSVDLNLTLSVFLSQLVSQLYVDAAMVALLNPHTLNLEVANQIGFRYTDRSEQLMRLGEGVAGRAAQERRVVEVKNLRDPSTQVHGRERLADLEGFQSYIAVPLIAKGQVKGVLGVFHRKEPPQDAEWHDFLTTLAGQAAIAIDNLQLFEEVQRSNVNLLLAYDETIEGWSRALDMRDKETEGHSQRVTEMTLNLARLMGVEEAQLVHIRRGALLHDIGKMGVPDAILLKPTRLNQEEWEIMRRHPELAYDLLSPIHFLQPALDIPLCHHEQWDGSGYPAGLKGVQIPIAARIFAIVDVWDALQSDRPYRAGWPPEQIIEHIKSLSSTHFDPRVVEEFLKMIAQL